MPSAKSVLKTALITVATIKVVKMIPQADDFVFGSGWF